MTVTLPARNVLIAGLAVVLLGLVMDRRLGFVLAVWLGLWALNAVISESGAGWARYVVPVLFGLALILLWELTVKLFDVPLVILPAPSDIAAKIATTKDLLWQDFVQTFVMGALSGYALGCTTAVLVAILVDRSPFLQKGVLPVGNFMAALPIVGTAPIFVMLYGFGWQSKAAVVFTMVFFPMLANTVAGLKEASVMQKDLMRTYAAGYWQTLLKLRLPAAMPFIFNGLKISSTLALIGAIVAEFFGSPIVGMGFRISTSVGQLALDMVWAEIAVAALAGSLFYGAVALIERWVTFWHPSQRK
jgi:NitT/TauT family transport system permease protein